mgnify:CR=1 FL=1
MMLPQTWQGGASAWEVKTSRSWESSGWLCTEAVEAAAGADTGAGSEEAEAVKGREDGSAVRLTLEKFDGSVSVSALRLDLQYWPTQLFERSDGVWSRREIAP